MISLLIYKYDSNIINQKHLKNILIEYCDISQRITDLTNEKDYWSQNLGILGLRDNF